MPVDAQMQKLCDLPNGQPFYYADETFTDPGFYTWDREHNEHIKVSIAPAQPTPEPQEGVGDWPELRIVRAAEPPRRLNRQSDYFGNQSLGSYLPTDHDVYPPHIALPPYLTEMRYVPAPQVLQEGEARGHCGENCKRCGHGNAVWSAPSPLWNAVMRGGSINGEEKYNDLVCAGCFMQLAEEQGIASRFRVVAKEVNVELETVTPSGRVWDEDRQLWTDPPTHPQQSTEEGS